MSNTKIEPALLAVTWCAVGAFAAYTAAKAHTLLKRAWQTEESQEVPVTSMVRSPLPKRAQLNRKSLSPELPNTIARNLSELVGNTPIVYLESLSRECGCIILGKAEFMNPCGSSKDRIAAGIINKAEEDGKLIPGEPDCIYEGTMGSTGISLACICLSRGYSACICVQNDVSAEKVNLLRSVGANVVLCPPSSIVDKNHYVNRAARLASEHTSDKSKTGKGCLADQFENAANWLCHYNTTGPELYEQTNGRIDAFVMGAGTGGAMTGIGKYLLERIPDVKLVLADPQGSGLYNKVMSGVMFDEREKEGTRTRKQVDTIVEGIGCNRLTANFAEGCDTINEAIRVTDEEAVLMSRYLVHHEGLMLGTSSAVHCAAAVKLARKMKPGSVITTLLCDSGERYMSKLYNKEYLFSRKLIPRIPDNLEFLQLNNTTSAAI